MRAVGYFRVIPGRKNDPPLMDQEKAFLQFCERSGYEPVATFLDIDSAERAGRAGYREMIDFLSRPEKGFAEVVVSHLDRLGRSPKDQAYSILELQGRGAKVMCSEETVADPLVAAARRWSQRSQRAQKRARARKAIRLKARKGEALGKPPYGYRIGSDRRFEVIPEEAATVALIYELYLKENLGLRLIARSLNERDLRTRKGGRWNTASIRDILRNSIYCGTYSSAGVRLSFNHPAVVTPEVFQRVQERLGRRPAPGGYAKREPFLLSGLAYCGYCGNRMIGVTRRRGAKDKGLRYRYYQCQSRTSQSLCQYHTRKAEELEGAVLVQLAEYSPGEMEEQAQPPSPRRVRAKSRALDRTFGEHLEQFARGEITPRKLRALHQENLEEQRALERELADLEAQEIWEATLRERRGRLLEALGRVREKWDTLSPSERRLALQGLVERIVVYDDRVETRLRL